MERELIEVILTDTHLSEDNFEQNRIVFNEAADAALKNGFSRVLHAGDVFDSREAQSLKELGYFDTILEDLKDKGIELIAIAGNHDKMSYTSSKSYLDLYRHHPNFNVISDSCELDSIEGIFIWMVPYFKENGCYQKKLGKVVDRINILKNEGNNEKNFLISHCAAETVRNNDGSVVTAESGVSLSMFDVFDHSYFGHYHEGQELVGSNHYIGSSLQHNFGESRGKGCTLLYSDGSYRTHRSLSKGYIRKDLAIGKDDPKSVLKELLSYKNDYQKVRIIGTKTECRVFDKSMFIESGIAVEKKATADSGEIVKEKKFVVHTVSSIKESFPEFISEKSIDKDKAVIGKKYINMLS